MAKRPGDYQDAYRLQYDPGCMPDPGPLDASRTVQERLIAPAPCSLCSRSFPAFPPHLPRIGLPTGTYEPLRTSSDADGTRIEIRVCLLHFGSRHLLIEDVGPLNRHPDHAAPHSHTGSTSPE